MPIPGKRLLVFLLATAVILLVAKGEAGAESARIVNGKSRVSGKAFLVSFQVEGAFTPDLEEAVMSGVPTSFTYFFRVFRDAPGLRLDERVFQFQVRRTVHYDNIRQTFTILMGEKGSTVTVKSFEAAKEKMTVFSDMPVSMVGALLSEDPYYLSVKARMEKVQFPFPFEMDFVFFFTSLWVFQTKWTRIELKPATPLPTEPPRTATPTPAEGNAP